MLFYTNKVWTRFHKNYSLCVYTPFKEKTLKLQLYLVFIRLKLLLYLAKNFNEKAASNSLSHHINDMKYHHKDLWD